MGWRSSSWKELSCSWNSTEEEPTGRCVDGRRGGRKGGGGDLYLLESNAGRERLQLGIEHEVCCPGRLLGLRLLLLGRLLGRLDVVQLNAYQRGVCEGHRPL